jgi:hypothetical protein
MMAWMGILAIVILSVVPAADRPVNRRWTIARTPHSLRDSRWRFRHRVSPFINAADVFGGFLLCWNRIASSPPADQTCPGQ